MKNFRKYLQFYFEYGIISSERCDSMKNRYGYLMSLALSAYSLEDVCKIFERVKKEGLKEHGFPRLVANIGILLSMGKRKELSEVFEEMADFVTEEITKKEAANEFSVLEIGYMISEVQKSKIVNKEKISLWKERIRAINPEKCYSVCLRKNNGKTDNWGVFALVSEFSRSAFGDCAENFVESELERQLPMFDENGMYRDPGCPAVYDLVPRALLCQLLELGYSGKYRDRIDENLKKAGRLTYLSQSPNGEIAFGGRSSGFVFNEAIAAAVLEYEAKRYKSAGDDKTAGEFKYAAQKALDCVEKYLRKKPVSHVKNRFSRKSGYGCEKYAYFDKYMITVASYLYMSYRVADDGIKPLQEEKKPYIAKFGKDFHKVFVYAGGYFLEFDTKADKNYDSSGLGRVIKEGAESEVCLSHPCTKTPKYNTLSEENADLSLAPGVFADEEPSFATENCEYRLIGELTDDCSAVAEFEVKFKEKTVRAVYTVSEKEVLIEVSGEGRVCHMIPAFAFDGNEENLNAVSGGWMEVEYENSKCRYTGPLNFKYIDLSAKNRSGHFRIFYVEGEEKLSLRIRIGGIDDRLY